MSLLTPLGLLAGLLSIPIILLYMLRLRRREVTISSTFLWQQILQDNEANTPWQKLRRNLLLFLQLLILLLLAFALARPFVIVPAISAGEIVVLLDASASMNATDVAEGTRFDEAKRRALEIVDTMGSGDNMTIIRVAGIPEVLASSTNDRLRLRNAIEAAQPSQSSADWGSALTLTRARANSTDDFNVVLISDGGLGTATNLPTIPGDLRYIPIGQSSSNLAITALATRERPGEEPQLFSQITNYGDEDAEVIFDLRVDGELFTAERFTVPANGDLPITSEALPDGFTILQAGLTIPSDSTIPDYLEEDNTAWSVPSGTTIRRALLMSPANLFLEQVLRSLPGVESFKGDINRGLPRIEFDLYVFDSWLPDELPDGDLFIVNPPSDTPLFDVGAITSATDNIMLKRDDPRLTFVDFDDVEILQFVQIRNADWADELITADGGPLLLAGEVDGRQVAVMTFDIHNSDLPLQITWPVLMSNLMEWFTPRDAISVPDGLGVGSPLAIHPPFDAETVRITLPDGETRTLDVDRETLVFAETNTPGIYSLEVMQGDTVLQSAQFAVNLFDANESNIAPLEEINLGGATITEAETEEIGQREFWPWLALAGLIILLIEWYVYHNRLRVPTAG
ncbi:MAG: VWA domain-containing protein, partial [Chloroflexi bacterium]